MLFLLNDMIVEVAVPEMHLQQRWREIGCGDPSVLRAQDAIGFVQGKVADHYAGKNKLSEDMARDMAALIITKTGANSLILKPTASGALEPRLRDLPIPVLETYQRGAANDGAPPAAMPAAQ